MWTTSAVELRNRCHFLMGSLKRPGRTTDYVMYTRYKKKDTQSL